MAIVQIDAFEGIRADLISEHPTVYINTVTNQVTVAGSTVSTYTTFHRTYAGGATIPYSYINNGQRVTLTASNTTPFATASLAATVSDITLLSVISTDETATSAGDGTIHAIARSSYNGIYFTLTKSGFTASSVTGVFTGLAPGTYTLTVTDRAGYTATQSVTISAYSGTGTVYGERYYIQFVSSQNNSNVFKVSFKQKGYTGSTTQLKPGSIPYVKDYLNNGTDKYSPITASVLSINLINEGSFNMTDFYSNDERQWKVEQFYNGTLDWQGWIIPDEITDMYIDGNYEVSLKATDGLESLTGFQFQDTAGQPYLGQRKLTDILQICLKNLGYSASKRIICSIISDQDNGSYYQYPNTYLYGDLFYDDNLKPDDCNTVISKICTALGWTLKQVKGNFIFSLANDLIRTSGSRIVTEYDANFNFAYDSSTFPTRKSIGKTGDYKPLSGTVKRFDKALPSVSVKHDFSKPAIYNTNRSFEVGATDGGYPANFVFAHNNGDTSVHELKFVPYAYDGSFVFRSHGTGSTLSGAVMPYSDSQMNAVQIVDTNLKFKITLQSYGNDTARVTPPFANFYITFTRNDFKKFYLQPDGTWIDEAVFVNEYNWEFCRISAPNNLAQWTEYSLESAKIPGIGYITFGILPSRAADETIDSNGNPVYTEFGPGSNNTTCYVDYDAIDITVTEFSGNDLTGDTWEILNKSGIFLGTEKSIDASLYDNINNPNLSGNIYTNNAAGMVISNAWKIIGKSEPYASLGKITAIAVLTNYQRPAIIVECDIFSDDVSPDMTFSIQGITGKVFLPVMFSHEPRKGTAKMTLIEIIDDTLLYNYKYTPNFAKNIRIVNN
jgi:hypothetical protein